MSAPPGRPPDLGALSPWAPELAQTFVSLASDIAMVIDDGGVIRNVAQGQGTPLTTAAFEWVGRPWVDTVTGDTRVKIEKLLAEVASTGQGRRREVNHPSGSGDTIPVAYTAIRLGERGPVLVAGRDLRAIAAIQQRFVEAQRELERGYWSARQAESRYRLLFQVATDAVLIVDAESFEILEANRAATQMFDMSLEHLLGRNVTAGFEHHSRGAVEELLTTARAGGRAAEIRARLTGKVTSTSIAATPFRSEEAMRLLVRVRDAEAPVLAPGTAERGSELASWLDGGVDAVVVTDSHGRVLAANPVFVTLVHAGSEADLKGRLLGDDLGLPRADVEAVLGAVRRQGLTRQVRSGLRGDGGATVAVGMSAALLTEGDQECVGFMLQCLAPSPHAQGGASGDGPGRAPRPSLGHLASRLGGTNLPGLLREAKAQAQHFLIETALARSAGDAGAAARLLGITRRTLARLRRAAPPPDA